MEIRDRLRDQRSNELSAPRPNGSRCQVAQRVAQRVALAHKPCWHHSRPIFQRQTESPSRAEEGGANLTTSTAGPLAALDTQEANGKLPIRKRVKTLAPIATIAGQASDSSGTRLQQLPTDQTTLLSSSALESDRMGARPICDASVTPLVPQNNSPPRNSRNVLSMKNNFLIILLAVAAALSTHFLMIVGAKWLQNLTPGSTSWGLDWLAILVSPIVGSLVLVKFFQNSELRNASIACVMLLTPPLFFMLSFYWIGAVFDDWL